MAKREIALVNSSEIAANRAGENVRAALVELSACENAIARRKNVRPAGEDEDMFHRRNQLPFDSIPGAPIIFTDTTNFGESAPDSPVFNSSLDDSESSSAASGNDFSFGGGDDAGGGGAGGSWENYS